MHSVICHPGITIIPSHPKNTQTVPIYRPTWKAPNHLLHCHLSIPTGVNMIPPTNDFRLVVVVPHQVHRANTYEHSLPPLLNENEPWQHVVPSVPKLQGLKRRSSRCMVVLPRERRNEPPLPQPMLNIGNGNERLGRMQQVAFRHLPEVPG